MMDNTQFSDQIFENELFKAQAARENGNEGKSRVCARRAAGYAIRKYNTSPGQVANNDSSFELIRSFAENPNLPEKIKQNAKNLTLRVSSDFEIPDGIDLITDARSIYEYLSKNIYKDSV